MLHGHGTDRWFDKSFTLCVGRNGRIGANCEHSWADAPIIGHLWEFLLGNDRKLGYDHNGNCNGSVETPPPRATKLRWDIQEEARKIFDANLKVRLHAF